MSKEDFEALTKEELKVLREEFEALREKRWRGTPKRSKTARVKRNVRVVLKS